MKQIKTHTFKTYALLALAAVSLITSCKKDNGYDFDGSISANVQLVNTSTDAGPSKLYVTDISRTPNAVSYNSASGYNLSYPGDGASAKSASGTTLATTNTSIDAAEFYTFFLTGTSANYSLIPVRDEVQAAASGKAKVRFVQAASGITSANLLGNGTSLFEAQSAKAVTAYNELSAGTYVFTVTNAGSSVSLAASTSVTLKAGGVYTVYTSGISGTTGTTALSVNVLTVK